MPLVAEAGGAATKGTLTFSAVWEPPSHENPILFDLVPGEERVVLGEKPLVVREGISLSSEIVPGARLAQGGRVLINSVEETPDGGVRGM